MVTLFTVNQTLRKSKSIVGSRCEMTNHKHEMEYDLLGIALGRSNNGVLEKILSLSADDFTNHEHKKYSRR